MRGSFFIAAFSIILFSFTSGENKRMTGHWTNERDLYDMKVNDTLIFTKAKYSDELYQWGGALCGIEINADQSFTEFHNVLCSSESSPVRYTDEKWSVSNDVISVSSSERELEWKVISLSKKKLTVLVTKMNIKNE
jgi:hypothetical protein